MCLSVASRTLDLNLRAKTKVVGVGVTSCGMGKEKYPENLLPLSLSGPNVREKLFLLFLSFFTVLEQKQGA